MINIDNLENAYLTLKECYQDYENNSNSKFVEYINDACVKRFEYTLEIAWKLAKRIFIQKYGKSEPELTINNIFRFMEGYGYTKNWENWKKYYQKRNDTAHEYNIIKARTLIEIVPDFLEDILYFIDKLKEEKDDKVKVFN